LCAEPQEHASQFRASLKYLINAPQLPPPEYAQPAGLATDVQVIEVAADASGNSPGGALRFCRPCGKSFIRNQELRRHWKQVHMPKRECPFEFCRHEWTEARPAKIKDHITEAHGSELLAVVGSELLPVVLQKIRDLRGKAVLEFVDAWAFDPYRRCVFLRINE
jgi:hypothetical protein